jgi:VWFA-related protein
MAMSLGAAALAAFAAGTGPFAAADPTAGLKHVDTVASDARGRSVTDLRPEEFEVLEDGEPLAIDSVRFVRADRGEPTASFAPIRTPEDEQAAAAADGTRLFALFLDEYHVSPAGAPLAAETIGRFVDRELGPRDLVVVVRPLDSLLTLRLTRDLSAVRSALEAFQGRKHLYEPRGALESSLVAGAPERIQAIRAQIAISALNALALHLGRLSGAPKTIVFVSEGFPRAARRRGEDTLPTVEGVIRSANRGGVSIYVLDPRALGPAATDGPPDEERTTLRVMATETRGHAIMAPDDLEAGLRRIAVEASEYYLIAFRPPSGEPDGRFHPVEVRVKRTGVRLRARTGYWMASPDDIRRARMAEAASAPKPTELPRRTSALIRPWFGLAPGSDDSTRVRFVWEPAPRPSGARAPARLPARIVLKAVAPDGATLFEGAVRPSAPAAVPGSEPAQAVFEAAPGRIRIEMSIEDADERRIDTDVRDVSVARFQGPVRLGTPEVFRLRTARELRAVEADPEAPPVAAREFTRDERLLVRVAASGVDAEVSVSARLVSRLGSVMRESLPVSDGPRSGLHQVDVPLAGLAVGEYTIELTATGAAGSVKDAVRFRLTR